MEPEIEPVLWVRAPIGVSALMNPIVWTMLSNKFTKSGFNVVNWLCDTTYRTLVKVPPVMNEVMDLNLPRGWNNFVDNFDSIMGLLFNLKSFRLKKGEIEPLQVLLKQNRDCIFSQYLPLPNRSLLVIEETSHGTYVDPIITGAVDAIRTMIGIDSTLANYSIRTKENRAIKTIDQLAEFYDNLIKNTLAKKEGIFRKHIFGTRSHFSFRGVISSLTEKHRYDEIHIPWGIGMSVFRIHIVNKLLRMNYTPNKAISFINEHAQKYHPILDNIFNELINESKYNGVSCVMQRNLALF